MLKKCLYPVAGYGTRFLPATKSMAKEMLPIVDKPLIQYAVSEAMDAGLVQQSFVTGRTKRSIEDHFDISYEIENEIKGSVKEEQLAEIREIRENCVFTYTRQREMKGLGHAILTGEPMIGDEAFGVILADDLCITEGDSVMKQMVGLYKQFRCSIIAIEEVPKEDTYKYGVISGEQFQDNLFKVNDMVEKPNPDEAPSNLAIIGRYILTPKIFEYLGKKEKGAGGEIQLTDAMKTLLKEQPIYGYKFCGQRFDCGDKAGFQMANLAFALERPEMRDKLINFIKKIQKDF